MITLKTGVPGSGKTLSAVQELQALHDQFIAGKSEPRPLYTNITGLALPHVFMNDCTKWRECPAGALIVIDEAYLFGYDAKSQQSQVPDYIRDLAVHRKDYSVDFIFIAQHPKLLHVALRRQVGKHQHYRRLFGWGRAVCYEWDSAQDNLQNTKTAVLSQWSYPKSVFKAYKSAEIHTKPKFKLPWFAWIPVVLLPLAAWAVPSAYEVLSGSMMGRGIKQTKTAPEPAKTAAPDLWVNPPAPPAVAASASVPAPVSDVVQPVQFAGCIVNAKGRCGCFSESGSPVPVEPAVCTSHTNNPDKPLSFPDSPRPRLPDAAELDALRFTFDRQGAT